MEDNYSYMNNMCAKEFLGSNPNIAVIGKISQNSQKMYFLTPPTSTQ